MRAGDVHVLHLMRALGDGGLERNALRVIRALGARGLRHSIAVIGSEPDQLGFDGDVEVHRLAPRPHSATVALELARLIDQLQPSVVHVRNLSTWPEAAAAHRLTHRPIPLVLSYHGSESCEPAPLVRRAAFNLLAREATRIFAVSEGARRSAAELYGLPLERVEVIANGVDTARFAPAQAYPLKPRGRVILGNVGRLSAIKNLQLLLRAFASLVRAGLDVELRIAGTGPEEARLRALASALGLADRVRLAGRVDDIPEFLHALDLFVLSSDLEGHPNALLEAMSSGVACVGTAVGGVPELLDYGRAGRLVAAGDQAGLSRALSSLIGDPQTRVELGARARARIQARFGEERMFDAYEALYRDPFPRRRVPARMRLTDRARTPAWSAAAH